MARAWIHNLSSWAKRASHLGNNLKQVIWCYWGEIELFLATLDQERLTEFDQSGKNPSKYFAAAVGNWARIMGEDRLWDRRRSHPLIYQDWQLLIDDISLQVLWRTPTGKHLPSSTEDLCMAEDKWTEFRSISGQSLMSFMHCDCIKERACGLNVESISIETTNVCVD